MALDPFKSYTKKLSEQAEAAAQVQARRQLDAEGTLQTQLDVLERLKPAAAAPVASDTLPRSGRVSPQRNLTPYLLAGVGLAVLLLLAGVRR